MVRAVTCQWIADHIGQGHLCPVVWSKAKKENLEDFRPAPVANQPSTSRLASGSPQDRTDSSDEEN